jgi:predicted secreted Zn-dependent protease
MVVKILRQRAALAMAADPRVASVAKEVRRRTQQMLRNPTSYEAPRH